MRGGEGASGLEFTLVSLTPVTPWDYKNNIDYINEITYVATYVAS